MKTTNNIKAAIKYFLLVAFAIVTLFPFYWMIASSLKSSFEVIQTPPTMVPDNSCGVILVLHYQWLLLEDIL